MKLYEITEKAKRIEELSNQLENEVIDEATGEIINKDDLIDEMNSEIINELKNKSAGLIKVSANMDSDIKAIDNEISRLLEMKSRIVKNKENFEKYILSNMIKLDEKKIETNLGKITVSESTSTEIFDADKIPAEFKKEVVKTEIKISKMDIKKQLKAGKEVPGAILKVNHKLKIKQEVHMIVFERQEGKLYVKADYKGKEEGDK